MIKVRIKSCRYISRPKGIVLHTSKSMDLVPYRVLTVSFKIMLHLDTVGYEIYDSKKGHSLGRVSVVNHKKYFYIENLYVPRAFRNKGYGKQLMNKVLNVFRRDCLQLNVEEGNTIAINMYKKLGFREIARDGISRNYLRMQLGK